MHVNRNIINLLLIFLAFGCKEEPQTSIQANFTIFPEIGDSLTLFKFDASSSILKTNDLWRVKVRWDWNSDGIWDTDFTLDKTAIQRFENLGSYKITMEALDITGATDTVSNIAKVTVLIKDSVITDSRDNQSYSVIKINNTWWMTQDLSFGRIIANTSSPSDNQIVERWISPDSGNASDDHQGFYTSFELTDYYRNRDQGICPAGWRIPTLQDCNRMNNFFYNNWHSIVNIDTVTYPFNPVNHGYFYQETKRFYKSDQPTFYWVIDSDRGYTYADFENYGFYPSTWNSYLEETWKGNLGQNFNRLWFGFAVRCIKSER